MTSGLQPRVPAGSPEGGQWAGGTAVRNVHTGQIAVLTGKVFKTKFGYFHEQLMSMSDFRGDKSHLNKSDIKSGFVKMQLQSKHFTLASVGAASEKLISAAARLTAFEKVPPRKP